MWKFRREDDPKRSSVWAHCTIIGDRKVRCDLCKAELVYLNGSTHNLKRHLEAKHTKEEKQNYSKSNVAEQELQELINLNVKRTSSSSTRLVLSSAIAEAMNIPNFRVADLDDLSQNMMDALTGLNGPAILEVALVDNNIPPMGDRVKFLSSFGK